MLKKYLLTNAALLLVSNYAHATNTGNLTVHFTNLSNDQGVVRVALFNSESAYTNTDDKGTGAFALAASEIHNNTADTTFKDIPYGTYAIRAYHDSDRSETLPRNFFGIPQTDYGFSNNPSTSFGPASFSAAKFNFQSPSANITIKMVQ